MDVKLKLTKQIAEDLGLLVEPNNLVEPTTLESLHWAWWVNPRNNGERSFRLTYEGYDAFANQFGLKFYKVDLPEDIQITNKTIVHLDKYIDCPFYINKDSIFLSREKVAVQMILFGGDINRFGLAKDRKKTTSQTT